MEHQFKPWQPVVVRMEDDSRWEADFFCRYLEGRERPYLCISGYNWKYCLPAEGNEHLVGTKDNSTQPEPEFQFGDKVEVLLFGAWVRGIFLCKMNNTCLYRVVTIAEVDEDKKERNNIKHYFKHCRHADW